MAVDDVKIGRVEALQGALDRFVDPCGAVVELGTCYSADFSDDEIILSRKGDIGILVWDNQRLACGELELIKLGLRCQLT